MSGRPHVIILASSNVAGLPSGTVTLLFTDIEGSTGLVRQLGDQWAGVLAEHRQLLRRATGEAGGREVDCRADDFMGVFTDPGDALRGAIAIQRAFAGHPWPEGAEVRVRIGVHTGEPEMGDGGYLGLEIHRAVRVGNAGHGGQIVVSEATAEHVGDGVDGHALRDLGEHQLAGLGRPERIFQLLVPDLRIDFPALRTAPSPVPENGKRVVLAEDSVLLREGVARILEDSGFEVVGQAGNAEELMLKVRSYAPDVAIVDIRMPPTHTDEGLRAAKEIREKHPGVGVLVLSQYVEADYALELLSESAEGVGYLLKDRVSDVKEFAAAVKRVAEGGSALDPTVVSQLVGRRRGDDPVSDLTPREREVLELMAEGRSNSGIAERLVVTERAVEKHVTSIFGKLRLSQATTEDHRRVLAVLAFLRS
jgi:DNA-binding NarL/FixJ family response regulator/class 3 adenylate cyclase